MPEKWMPEIINERCTGCGLCVENCRPRSLAIIDRKAVLAFPDTCGSEQHCIAVCEDSAIYMRWHPFDGSRATGKWRDGAC